MNSHRCCKTAGIANVFVVILCAFHFLPCGASELMIFLQAEDKAELGQYEVHLMRNAKSISQSSDAKGTCRFRALSPGKYRIEVDSGDDSYANYYIAAKEINLGSEKKKVVIRLPMRHVECRFQLPKGTEDNVIIKVEDTKKTYLNWLYLKKNPSSVFHEGHWFNMGNEEYLFSVVSKETGKELHFDRVNVRVKEVVEVDLVPEKAQTKENAKQ